MMTSKFKSLAFFALAISLQGCSVFMAANQPSAKNVELFNQGTLRAQLIAEFGAPANTKTRPDGTACDIFTFTQGYSGGAKATRAIAHGLADLFTLGLWEVVGTPTEAVFSGDNVSYQACYDKNDRVNSITLLTPNNDGRGRPDVGMVTDSTNTTALTPATPTAPPKQTVTAPINTEIDSSQNRTSPSVETSTSLTGGAKQKLQELEGLKKEGLISEADYQNKRKSIIKDM